MNQNWKDDLIARGKNIKNGYDVKNAKDILALLIYPYTFLKNGVRDFLIFNLFSSFSLLALYISYDLKSIKGVVFFGILTSYAFLRMIVLSYRADAAKKAAALQAKANEIGEDDIVFKVDEEKIEDNDSEKLTSDITNVETFSQLREKIKAN